MTITPEQFQLRIKEARDIFTDYELSQSLTVSTYTLEQWAAGRSYPVENLAQLYFNTLDEMLSKIMNAPVSNEQFKTAIQLVIHNPTFGTSLLIPYLRMFNLKLRDVANWRAGVLPEACTKPLIYKMTKTFLKRNNVTML